MSRCGISADFYIVGPPRTANLRRLSCYRLRGCRDKAFPELKGEYATTQIRLKAQAQGGKVAALFRCDSRVGLSLPRRTQEHSVQTDLDVEWGDGSPFRATSE